MDKDKIYEYLAGIDHLTQDIRDEMLKPDIPEFETIPVGAELQSYLDKGGRFKVAEGSTGYAYSGGYEFKKPTVLNGIPNCVLLSNNAPGVRFPKSYVGGVLRMMVIKTTGNEIAMLVGLNTTEQNTIELVPSDLVFEAIYIAGHRGKRGIECNSRQTTFKDCFVQDVYDPEKQDSQALSIMNTSGDIEVLGGLYEAASESIMVGGDKMKIPGVHPQNILLQDVQITKRLDWRGNTAIPVKNLLELKDGWGVIVRRCTLWNCWSGSTLGGAQQGEAFMFTPKSGGQVDVTVEDCLVNDVSRIVNITGMDITGNTVRTRVQFLRGDYRTNKSMMGGDGRFCLITGGPESVIFRGIFARAEGSAFIDIDSKHVDYLELTDSDVNFGQYGIRIGGQNYGDNSLGIVGTIKIENNRITGANSQFKARYPNNVWL